MINPYAPVDITIEQPPATGRAEPSLVWFGVPIASLLFVRDLYYSQELIRESGAINAVFESVRDVSMHIVGAVMIYAAARYIVRLRFDYSSTHLSLVGIGVLACGYIALLLRWDWYNTFKDEIIWSVGVFAGLVLAVGLSMLERKFANAGSLYGDELATSTTESIRNHPNHAGIFWFSGAVGLSIAVFFGLTDGQWTVFDLADVSSTMCVIFTTAYGIFSACIRRHQPATSVSRIGAAAVYVGIVILMTFWMPAPGSQIIIPVVIFGPAVFAVLTDRLITRFSARV